MKKRGRRGRRRKFYEDQLSELSELLVSSLLEAILKRLRPDTRQRISDKSETVNDKPSIKDLSKDEKRVKQAAYRVMDLKPGCGAEAVKSRFRSMTHELRPDIATKDEKTSKKWAAIKASREVLLKYET